MIKNYVDIDTKLDKVNDECGVFGIYRNDDDIDVVAAANDALYSLQHRGQAVVHQRGGIGPERAF